MMQKTRMMEDFSKKIAICSSDNNVLDLLRRFVGVQERRAQAYSRLKRGFEEYMVSGGELAYQQLCSDMTLEFNECSKEVIQIETLFKTPDYSRHDLAALLRSVQIQEKHKLQLTATLQVLKKAGRPCERPVSHENCRISKPMGHQCVHIHQITEASGTEDAEADAEYDNAVKEAIKGVQDAVIAINEHLEEIRYEIAALEAQPETQSSINV